jgi:histidine triad (HIT) family protein
MSDCIFCQIVAGDAPAEIVHQDDDVIAFTNIDPKAPVHLLVIPRAHHPNLESLSNPSLSLKLFETARHLGDTHSPEHGYHLAVNSGKQAEVPHLHFHVLGGQSQADARKGGGHL